ncbi:MAG: UDP-N-acetylmuramoyl-tripeptide--D-alanyl-D-alanine ligase [Oscillospiraceae bacterium]|nr:UDP-N-acetylmuramoyl-tripeptide--D-alanyl-D-alanine ligase [Oscillospiraceae bacterium]
MGKLTLKQAAAWCGGWVDPKYENIEFLGANNDTRVIQPGQLFIVLQGARDGHDFIPMAMEKGAAAVLCSRRVGDYPAIIVDDPRIALGDIARQERRRIGFKAVGITGSVGKSTTKEMVAAVLESTFRTAKTPVNHNNDIGMPMAILAMPEDTQVAVLEMGMNHFREMAYLSSIAQPDIAVIVNIGSMHIEHLGSIEGIRKAKLEILEGMTPDGKLLLNGDDQMLRALPQQPEQEITYFGKDKAMCAVQVEDIQQTQEGLRFHVTGSHEEFVIQLGLEGEHFVADAMAAVTVALELGVIPVRIQERLAMFRNMAGRQEIFHHGETTIISDCYNAGPESMAAALAVLGKKDGRRIAVLGDMLELGDCAWAEHYRIGRIAAENAELIFAYGPNADRVVKGAITGGMAETKARSFGTHDELAQTLKFTVKPGDVLLFKGSRGMHMELVLEKFLKEEK